MSRLPANWSATGGGPSGHGGSLGSGNFQYNGQDQNAVENAVNAIPAKGAAVAVATTPQAGTYSQPGGSSVGVGATFTYAATGPTTYDGHMLAAGEWVLLVAQAAAAQNGLYAVTTAGATGVATVLTRVASLNSAADFPGALVMVYGGLVYAATLWVCTAAGSPVMGTDPLPWAQARRKKRISTAAAPTSLALNTDTFDVFKATGINVPLSITATGNPGDDDQMKLVLSTSGAVQPLSWDAAVFTAFGVIGGLPAAVPANRKMTMQFVRDNDLAKWVLAAVDSVGYSS